MRRSIALFIALTSLFALGGCAASIELEPELTAQPLTRQFEVTVGTYVTAAARTARASDVLVSAEIGKISQSRFEQAFAALFKETRRLPDWPPWRHTHLSDLRGVIELESVECSLEIGDDANTPDVVTLAYRVCLYEPQGEEVACWSTSSSQSHQRVPFEFDFQELLSRQMEYVIRDAVAQFLVQAERDLIQLDWASK